MGPVSKILNCDFYAKTKNEEFNKKANEQTPSGDVNSAAGLLVFLVSAAFGPLPYCAKALLPVRWNQASSKF